MPRGVRKQTAPPVAFVSNTVKIGSHVPSDRQWMVFELVRRFVEAQLGTGIAPTIKDLGETYEKAEYLVNRVLSND